MLQYAFQSFFVTAGKPDLGFVATVGAGLMNMVLDAVFIIAFGWGIAGAAAATAASGLTDPAYLLRTQKFQPAETYENQL